MRQKICEDSIAQIQQICATHFSIMLVFVLLNHIGLKGITLPVALISFVNSICLAERCWVVQRRTMECWSLQMQAMFLILRLAAVAVMLAMLWLVAHRV
jgi:hypothetical protein